MNSYLNAKLILFKEVLQKNQTVISDKEIKPFSIIKKYLIKNLKLFDISKEFENIKNTFLFSAGDFK